MDIRDIKQLAVRLRGELKKHDIHGDVFILYGSYSTGKNRADSDIDLAIVSRDFGKDRFREGSLVNYLASDLDPLIEAVPVSLDDYLSPEPISPLLAEIDKNGVILL